MKRVVVGGGGVAGIVAALTLAEAGASVVLVEASPFLGGRLATTGSISFEHRGAVHAFPREHGLHGIWSQYRNLRRLVDGLGPTARLRSAETQALVFEADGPQFLDIGARIRGSRVPDALAQLLLFADRRVLRACVSSGPVSFVRGIGSLGHVFAFDVERDLARYDDASVADLVDPWPEVMRRMFTALAHSGFFAEPRDVSLAAFLLGLQHYVVGRKGDSAFDVFDADTATCFLEPARARLASLGGELRTGVRVEGLLAADGRAVGVRLADEATIAADAVVLALDPPGYRALDRAGLPLPETPVEGLPSTVVRLFSTRDVAPGRAPTGVLATGPADNFFWLHRLQAPFRAWHRATGGAVLECHLYAANERRARDRADHEVAAELTRFAERAWPELEGAVVHADVQRNAATHVAFHPGTTSRLPSPATVVPNVALAGDWIRARHPVLYLERACSTGLEAARHVGARLGLDLAALPEPLAPFPWSTTSRVGKLVCRASIPILPDPRRARAAGQGAQVPATHVVPVAQALPHVPQSVSVVRSTSQPFDGS